MAGCSTPTIGEVLAAYPGIAELERMRGERPSRRTVANVVMGVKRIVAMLDKAESQTGGRGRSAAVPWMQRPLSDLKRGRLDGMMLAAGKMGLRPITVWSYISALKGLTARWCLPYYRDRGWKVSPMELPPCRRRAPRYARPERETLLKVKEWYDGLWARDDKRCWLAATMMLEFAMRNGDVGRLRWSDFRARSDGSMVLCYTPHKTELSSGRVVAWPVHPDIWTKMEAVRIAAGIREGTHFQGLVVPAAHQVFVRLNAELRARHLFTGCKAAYELRKICIDHIYQKFGAEMASSISGDDIRTVTHYYADPSAVNAGAIRVVDLL